MLSLFTSLRHCGIIQSFLTSAQGGEEWWTLCSSGFTARNKLRYPLNGRANRPPELMWTFCWRRSSMFINWNFYLICNLTNKHIKISRIFCFVFQLRLFSLQLLHRKVKFTACGFFPLDFTLLYSVRNCYWMHVTNTNSPPELAQKMNVPDPDTLIIW